MSANVETRQLMSETDKQAASEWFATIKEALDGSIKALRRTIKKTPSVSEQKPLLQAELARVLGLRTMVEKREEAFVADNSNQAMRPPSDQDIQATKDIAARMAEAIAQQKKAEAIAGLVNELAALATKVSSLGEKAAAPAPQT